MIYSELKLYLKTNLKKPTLEFKWNEDDNKNFFHFLRKFFPKHHILDDDNKEDIKRAFKDYFEHIGYIVFQLKDEQIRLKVLPYKIDPKDSVNLEALIEILNSNEDLCEFNYKDNENQILIQKDLKYKLYGFIDDIKNEDINKSELIKHSIREALELEDSDIIVIKEDSIFIKLLSQLKRKQINLEEKETIANRYNGIDEDELIFFYTEYFSQEENKNFFYLVAQEFVEVCFIEENINNEDYEKNVFSDIQNIIIEQLVDTFDYNESFFKGFSGYIFRIHFQEVFSFIADFILYEISASNTYMVDFLKYYSLNIIVINGMKYRVPALEAENGMKWNVISIMSVAKIYMKVKESVENLQEDVYEIDAELYEMFIGELSPVEYNNELTKHKNEITEDIAQGIKELKIFSDKYDFSKDNEEKKTLKKEIQEIKNELQGLKENRDNIMSKVVDKSVISKYRALEKEMDGCFRQLKAEEKILSQNVNSYRSVKNALSKALISKKKRI